MKKYTLNNVAARLVSAFAISLAIGMILTFLNLENQQNMMVSFPWECAIGQPPCNPPSIMFPWSNFFILFIPTLLVQEVLIFFYSKNKK